MNKTMTTRILLAACCGMVSASMLAAEKPEKTAAVQESGNPEPVPLTSFEDSALIKLIGGGSTRSQATLHVTDGSHSLQVDFFNTDYPNIVFPAAIFATDDWSKAGALTFDAFNADGAPMRIIIRCRDASGRSCDTEVTLPPGLLRRVALVLHLPNRVKMQGYPVQQACSADLYGSYGGGFLDKPVASVEFFTDHPGRVQTAYFDRFRLESIKHLKKIIDPYGQSNFQKDWPGKIHSDEDLITAHRLETAGLLKNIALLQESSDLDSYGGWATGPQLKATGWFRTEKLDGKWWLVTPSGHLFWSTGITDVAAGCANIPGEGNLDLCSWLPVPGDSLSAYSWWWGVDFFQMNLYRTYGRDWQAAWRALTGKRMTAWGFNTLGAWSGEQECAELKKPFTVDLGGGGGDSISGIPDSYSRAWAGDLEDSIRKQTAVWKNNPLCIGYFVSNEIGWTGPGGLPVEVLLLSGTRAVKGAFVTLLKNKYSTIENLNKAWGIASPSWTGWGDFESNPVVLPGSRNAALDADLGMLLSAFADRYYSTVAALVKKYAPNQLYLGSRMSQLPPDEVAMAAGKHCDVVTYNIYGKSDTLLSRGLQIAKFDKPVLVGEFHFGALDCGMFSGGMAGVENQRERGLQYAKYVNTALAQPWCVGAHWFQYIDEPILGRGDGENFNIGLVSVCDVPYPELIEQVRKVNAAIYQTRDHVVVKNTGSPIETRPPEIKRVN